MFIKSKKGGKKERKEGKEEGRKGGDFKLKTKH